MRASTSAWIHSLAPPLAATLSWTLPACPAPLSYPLQAHPCKPSPSRPKRKCNPPPPSSTPSATICSTPMLPALFKCIQCLNTSTRLCRTSTIFYQTTPQSKRRTIKWNWWAQCLRASEEKTTRSTTKGRLPRGNCSICRDSWRSDSTMDSSGGRTCRRWQHYWLTHSRPWRFRVRISAVLTISIVSIVSTVSLVQIQQIQILLIVFKGMGRHQPLCRECRGKLTTL